MSKKRQFTQNEKNLIRRYLVWCYKTTKEELDKISSNEDKQDYLEKKYGKEPIITKDELDKTRWSWH